WSTAVAIVLAISLIWPMVPPMPWIAATVSLVARCMALIWAEISSVAFAVWLDRLFTSEATTAKPRPASPARAASMVAFSASRLVWLAMALIMSVTAPILAAASARLLTRSL